MSDRLSALRASVEHLRSVVEELETEQHVASAYPSEWSIADTLSHLGSGAVISKRRLHDVLEAIEPDPAFNQATWDEWNALTPSDQIARALVVDLELLEALEATTSEQRDGFHFAMGPFNLDFAGFVGLRLNEHALHTWDVEVAVDPTAKLSSEIAGAIIDNLEMIVRFAGKAHGEAREVSIRTSDPVRDFTLEVTEDAVTLAAASHSKNVDVEIPAEAFVRLVYGRLDSANATAGISELHLESLQKSFPGF
jgi:uncharacterized protein (TIGR03083 family)